MRRNHLWEAEEDVEESSLEYVVCIKSQKRGCEFGEKQGKTSRKLSVFAVHRLSSDENDGRITRIRNTPILDSIGEMRVKLRGEEVLEKSRKSKREVRRSREEGRAE